MTWAPACQHRHVSGRPCEGMAAPGSRYCIEHYGGGSCATCASMLTTFMPPAGWGPGVQPTRRKS